MGGAGELRTERLVLRRWREEDLAPFAEMNADPEVMEHFPAPLSRAESDAMVGRIERSIDSRGYGLWAVEVAATNRFVGFTGVHDIPFTTHFTPAVEVGWRLARPAWGHGYATEAARAAIAFAFDRLGLAEVVSMTTVTNLRSQTVMRRLGMTRDPADDFAHPHMAADHPLSACVLYRLPAPPRPPLA